MRPLAFVLLVVTSLIYPSISYAETPEAQEALSIQGIATIELKIGNKQYLKGLELALIPEAVVPKLKEIRNTRWLEEASRFNFGAGYYYLDLNSIGYFAVKNAITRSKTNAKGAYQFTNIPEGNYRIYGQYKSRYASGYWLIPVEITKESKTIRIDINNENFEEIYNRDVR
ncbi:MAG: hypothetical protein AAF558_11055 [Verrucomicrobiota bacterium]